MNGVGQKEAGCDCHILCVRQRHLPLTAPKGFLVFLDIVPGRNTPPPPPPSPLLRTHVLRYTSVKKTTSKLSTVNMKASKSILIKEEYYTAGDQQTTTTREKFKRLRQQDKQTDPWPRTPRWCRASATPLPTHTSLGVSTQEEMRVMEASQHGRRPCNKNCCYMPAVSLQKKNCC